MQSPWRIWAVAVAALLIILSFLWPERGFGQVVPPPGVLDFTNESTDVLIKDGVIIQRKKTCCKITLAWDANTEPDLKGYNIYYGTAPGDYDNLIDVAEAVPECATPYDPFKTECCEITIIGLKKDTYYFAATAYDQDDNESAYSEELEHIFLPGRPFNFREKGG